AHETPQCQRVCQTPSNAALRSDALEIPDQQSPKIDPRRQRRSPVLGRIKLRAPLLDKLVEALRLQQLIQTLIKRMPRRRCQLRVRDPQPVLLLPLLARPHRHPPILRTNPVHSLKDFARESRLAPRAARQIGWRMALYLGGKASVSTNDLSPKEATQMSHDVKYIGMDVHKEAIVIAVL